MTLAERVQLMRAEQRARATRPVHAGHEPDSWDVRRVSAPPRRAGPSVCRIRGCKRRGNCGGGLCHMHRMRQRSGTLED